MHRTFPRLVSCGAFAGLLLLLLPVKSLAQHQQGCGGGGGVGCPNRVAYLDEANPKPTLWCGATHSGSVSDTHSADGVYETVYSSGNSTCTPKTFFEWIWVFNNVPAGNRYLTFTGHSDSNHWQLYYRSCPEGGDACPTNPINGVPQVPCPTDFYHGLLAVNGVIDPGPADSGGTIPIGSNSVASTVCVLLQLCVDPDCEVIQPVADAVHIDLLEVSTNLANSCATLNN